MATMLVLTLVCMGGWVAGAVFLPIKFSTLFAVSIFLASVGFGVVLVCTVFCAIEKMAGPLFP